MLGAVPAVHGGEDAIGARLERHVKVPGNALGGSKKVDKILGNVQRLDGADAETLDGGFVEDAAEEVFEFNAGREVTAVSSEVNPAEHDFAVSRSAELLYFLDDSFRREAAASAANKGDHAKRTSRIAAILNLKRRARVIPFPAKNRRAQQGILLEDIAVENFFGKSGR
jgi:hypothetical protein